MAELLIFDKPELSEIKKSYQTVCYVYSTCIQQEYVFAYENFWGWFKLQLG